MKDKTPLIVKERLVRTHRQGWQLKYYTSISYHKEHLDKDGFVKQLLKRTTFNESQIIFLLGAASELMLESIEKGYVVEIPFWGIYKLSLHTMATTDRQAAGQGAITQLRINYKPHVKLLASIADNEFETEYRDYQE